MLQPHMPEYVRAKPVAEVWTVKYKNMGAMAITSAKSRTSYCVYDVPKIPTPKLVVSTGYEQTNRSTHM